MVRPHGRQWPYAAPQSRCPDLGKPLLRSYTAPLLGIHTKRRAIVNSIDKKSLSERDICTKFITPAVVQAGWDSMTQIREEVSFTKGRIIVRGKLVTRGKAKRADHVLYYKPNLPLALSR